MTKQWVNYVGEKEISKGKGSWKQRFTSNSEIMLSLTFTSPTFKHESVSVTVSSIKAV